MDAVDISILSLLASYALLIVPLGIMLWQRIPAVNQTLISIARMTVQLLFVGLYLQVVFKLNNFWLNAAWLVIMICVADISILRGCHLRVNRLIGPLFPALLIGTALPTFFFLGPILRRPQLLDAQYAIPIAGMILGNCLRSDIIGISHFYQAIQKSEKAFLQTLAQGATLSEATRPFLRDAFQAALAPYLAIMATIGLVSLPGMMTGVILGGADPMVAIKYQIAIIIAILTGTTVAILLALKLTMKSSFTAYGTLDRGIFRT